MNNEQYHADGFYYSLFIIHCSLFIVHPSLTKYDGTEEENQ